MNMRNYIVLSQSNRTTTETDLNTVADICTEAAKNGYLNGYPLRVFNSLTKAKKFAVKDIHALMEANCDRYSISAVYVTKEDAKYDYCNDSICNSCICSVGHNTQFDEWVEKYYYILEMNNE